ncbi:MAG: hypothetical protein QOE53_2100, partial [Pseudonocardiales bacterium]|nr:hypothetical protein [Pseudonocardiales bacterium]
MTAQSLTGQSSTAAPAVAGLMAGPQLTRAVGTEAGRLCQALVARIDDVEVDRLAEKVAQATGTQLWQEQVPGAAESAIGARRRERELSRPADPQTGPGVRVVLLRYPDGPADLVVVAHRAVAEPCSVLRAVLTEDALPVTRPNVDLLQRLQAGLTRLDRVEPPDWGLGRAGVDAVGSHPFTVPPTGYPPAGAASVGVLLTAALGLVLARCAGADRASIGQDPMHSAEFGCAASTPVAGYLNEVRQACECPSSDAAPVVGLTVSAIRPFLDPLHPLSICVEDNPAGPLQGVCRFRHNAFDPAVVERFAGMVGAAYRSLAAADPNDPIGALALFDDGQLRELAELGGLGRPLPAPVTGRRIEDLVRAQAEHRPDAIAVSFQRRHLSYRELDERANQAAHALQAAGIGAGDRVGVCLKRSLDLVVMLLAVLKAGAAYVPMDAGYPDDRLAFTATDAQLPVVITDPERFPQLPGVRLLAPDDLQSAAWPVTVPVQDGGADDPAYVIYTSGSTGRPKGVVVSHRNVLSLLSATSDDFALSSSDVW